MPFDDFSRAITLPAPDALEPSWTQYPLQETNYWHIGDTTSPKDKVGLPGHWAQFTAEGTISTQVTIAFYKTKAGTIDQSVSAAVSQCKSGTRPGTNPIIGVLLRASDASNFYYVCIDSVPAWIPAFGEQKLHRTVNLFRRINGTDNLLARFRTTEFEVLAPILALSATGNLLEVKLSSQVSEIDNPVIMSVSDNNLSTGEYCGIYAAIYGGTGFEAVFLSSFTIWKTAEESPGEDGPVFITVGQNNKTLPTVKYTFSGVNATEADGILDFSGLECTNMGDAVLYVGDITATAKSSSSMRSSSSSSLRSSSSSLQSSSSSSLLSSSSILNSSSSSLLSSSSSSSIVSWSSAQSNSSSSLASSYSSGASSSSLLSSSGASSSSSSSSQISSSSSAPWSSSSAISSSSSSSMLSSSSSSLLSSSSSLSSQSSLSSASSSGSWSSSSSLLSSSSSSLQSSSSSGLSSSSSAFSSSSSNSSQSSSSSSLRSSSSSLLSSSSNLSSSSSLLSSSSSQLSSSSSSSLLSSSSSRSSSSSSLLSSSSSSLLSSSSSLLSSSSSAASSSCQSSRQNLQSSESSLHSSSSNIAAWSSSYSSYASSWSNYETACCVNTITANFEGGAGGSLGYPWEQQIEATNDIKKFDQYCEITSAAVFQAAKAMYKIPLCSGNHYAQIVANSNASTSDENAHISALVRVRNNRTQYFTMQMYSNGAYDLTLYKRVNGTSTIIGSAQSQAFWGTLKCQASGTTITSYFDGGQIHSVTDSDIPANGGVGFRLGANQIVSPYNGVWARGSVFAAAIL